MQEAKASDMAEKCKKTRYDLVLLLMIFWSFMDIKENEPFFLN
jgi:hypothetical protein